MASQKRGSARPLSRKVGESSLQNTVRREMQFLQGSIYADQVGVKTPESVFKGFYHSRDNRYVSEEYLLNCGYASPHLGRSLGIAPYSTPQIVANNTLNHLAEISIDDDEEQTVELPVPKKLRLALGDAALSRRSHHEFSSAWVPLESLSSFLY